MTRDREGAQLTADPGLEGSIPEREWTAEQVHALALRVLTLGPKTAMELSRRLLRKGVPVGHVEVEVAELQRLGVLDDALYAQLWVDSRVHAKGLARGRLSRELRAKGVDDALVAAALAEVDPVVEEAAACAIVARRLATMSRLTPEVQTRRLVGVLARRGYPEGMARRVVLTAMREGQCGQGAQQP